MGDGHSDAALATWERGRDNAGGSDVLIFKIGGSFWVGVNGRIGRQEHVRVWCPAVVILLQPGGVC